MNVAVKICGWCQKPKRVEFHRGKRASRCDCDHDYRTPIEVRRDAVLEKYGDDPEAYTPPVLAELAKSGLLDIADAFCPAGRLSMAETRKREASAIEAPSGGETSLEGSTEGESAVPEGETPR